jgi:hypothetical protein
MAFRHSLIKSNKWLIPLVHDGPGAAPVWERGYRHVEPPAQIAGVTVALDKISCLAFLCGLDPGAWVSLLAG